MPFRDLYNYYMVKSTVPLTRNWPLISSPFEIIFITVAYLYFVLNFGPRYMKNKQPYNLRTFILFYNFIQILANFWMLKEYVSAGWLWKYIIKCFPPNPTGPDGVKMYHITWWVLILKIFDYVETCVFVLRKKQNQVSVLHVYHHVTNLMLGWYYLKYILDERVTFIVVINNMVHILMYIYYFLAAWSPKLQKMISPFKLYVTRIQMVQFVVIILILLQGLLPDCPGLHTTHDGIVFTVLVINILLYIYLFNDFYKKTYSKSIVHKHN